MHSHNVHARDDGAGSIKYRPHDAGCGSLAQQRRKCGKNTQKYRCCKTGFDLRCRPLLDRIDLHIEVPEVKYRELTGERDGETSRVVAGRIRKARRLQLGRLGKLEPTIFCNAQMGARETERYCRLDSETQALLHRKYFRKMNPTQLFDGFTSLKTAGAGRLLG